MRRLRPLFLGWMFLNATEPRSIHFTGGRGGSGGNVHKRHKRNLNFTLKARCSATKAGSVRLKPCAHGRASPDFRFLALPVFLIFGIRFPGFPVFRSLGLFHRGSHGWSRESKQRRDGNHLIRAICPCMQRASMKGGMENFYACFSNANRLAFFYAPLNGQPKGRQSSL